MNSVATPGRVIAVDAFRGLTIAAMLLVNNPGSWDHVYPPLEHAAWNGWTPTDLIFPFFLFTVGISVSFALGRRIQDGVLRRQLLTKIAVRSLALFTIGLLLNGFPQYHLSTIRIPGVLQRIAVVYLVSALAYLFCGRRTLIALTGFLLAGYWLIMKLVPVPGHGAGILDPQGNLAQYVDLLVLRGHTWKPDWDPEGILSTIPAIATCLLGIMTGEWLRGPRAAAEKVVGILVWGNLGMVAGVILGVWFPINKNLWSPSYVVFTAGMGLVMLGVLCWMTDEGGRPGGPPVVIRPFIAFGANAILAFVLSGLLARVLILWKVPGPGGAPEAMQAWLYQRLFASWAGPLNGSLLYAVAYVLLWLAVMGVLYRRRVFVSI